jgi:hypothetical protein
MRDIFFFFFFFFFFRFQGTENAAPEKWHQEGDLRVTERLEQQKCRSKDAHLTEAMLSPANGCLKG